MKKTIEAYEANANLMPEGIKLFGEDGHWLRNWNVNSDELRVSYVKLELVIPAEGDEPNRFASLWLSPEEFGKLGMRLHDGLNANIVVTAEEDTVVREGREDYKVVHFDVHDYELSVVRNSKLSERRNKPFPKLTYVAPPKRERAGGAEDDE